MKYAQKSATALALSLGILFGSAANAEPKQEKIGDWTLYCEGADCTAAIGGKIEGLQNSYVKIGVAPGKDDGILVAVRVAKTPAVSEGTYLPLLLDGKQLGSMIVQECNPEYCSSEIHEGKEFADRFLAADEITVAVMTSGERGYYHHLSGDGLREAVTKARAKLTP